MEMAGAQHLCIKFSLVQFYKLSGPLTRTVDQTIEGSRAVFLCGGDYTRLISVVNLEDRRTCCFELVGDFSELFLQSFTELADTYVFHRRITSGLRSDAAIRHPASLNKGSDKIQSNAPICA